MTISISSYGTDADARQAFGWPLALAAMMGFAISTALLCMADPDLAQRLTLEAGPVESLGAAAYLAASVVCALAFMRSRRRPGRFFTLSTRGNWWLALLGLFFLVCCGEETSWGQSYLQWGTPSTWGGINAQNETNLHNLWLFQGINADGSQKSQLELFLYPGRLMALLWLTYCLAVPLLNAGSALARRLFAFVGLPVPPLMIGMLFIAAYACAKVAMIWPGYAWLQSPVSELQETNYAVCFFALALMFHSAEAGQPSR